MSVFTFFREDIEKMIKETGVNIKLDMDEVLNSLKTSNFL
jgi:hypothetical protein